jgi:hypothetical protein
LRNLQAIESRAMLNNWMNVATSALTSRRNIVHWIVLCMGCNYTWKGRFSILSEQNHWTDLTKFWHIDFCGDVIGKSLCGSHYSLVYVYRWNCELQWFCLLFWSDGHTYGQYPHTALRFSASRLRTSLPRRLTHETRQTCGFSVLKLLRISSIELTTEPLNNSKKEHLEDAHK